MQPLPHRRSNAFMLGCLLLLQSQVLYAAEPDHPPNVVLILADDLGYGDLSCYGQQSYQTPRIDRLASEGVRFTNFYVPVPYCGPSRATLLTGRYPFHHGQVANPAPDSGKNEVGLPASEITLAEVLKERGYATTCIGKWHLGHTAEFLPQTQGFDEYFGILYSNDMRPVQLVRNAEVVEYPIVQGTLTRRYTDAAVDFVERHRDSPFFLYLPHAMPHKPLAASEDFYTYDTPDDLYADVLRELDWSVGVILDKLDELKLSQNTLVIFSSDNGPWYGGSTAGLRGMKSTTWEGGLRVPTTMRLPGRIPAGEIRSQPAGTIDVFPTVCQLVGAPLPHDRVIDGVDLAPVLQSAEAAPPHEALYGMRGSRMHTVRSGPWKLHVRSPGASVPGSADWSDPRGPDGITIIAQHEQANPSQYPGAFAGVAPHEGMLFNLEEDPAETTNVAQQHPDVVRRLEQLLADAEAELVKLEIAPDGRGSTGIMHLRGGALRYDRLISPAGK